MTSEPEPTAEPIALSDDPKTKELAKRLVLRDPYQDYWSNVVLWISLAESMWPLVVVVCAGAGRIVSTGELGVGFGYALASICAALGIGFTLLFACTLLVSGIIASVVGLASKTLDISARGLPIGAFTGGCVGILFALPTVGASDTQMWFMVLPVGLAQAGGAYGAWRTFYRAQDANGPSTKFRFGIKQLMILTAWLAVFLTGLKLTGMTTANNLQLVATWVVLQVVGMFAAWMWERWR